jgi:hypothetical protein
LLRSSRVISNLPIFSPSGDTTGDTKKTESHEHASVLPLDLTVRVCDNVNTKTRIAAICAIVAFATCGGRAPAQFPGCAYILVTQPCPFSIKAQGDCQSSIPSIDPQEACQGCPQGAQAFYVVSNRKDGQVKVTILFELWGGVVPGNRTFTDQVLTLAPGERRKLGCTLPPPQTGYRETPTKSVQWTEPDGTVTAWVFDDWSRPAAPGVTWSVKDCQPL